MPTRWIKLIGLLTLILCGAAAGCALGVLLNIAVILFVRLVVPPRKLPTAIEYWGLWVPFVTTLGTTIAGPFIAFWWAFVRRGGPPPGFCKCGYNLTGNVTGVCSECGTPVGGPVP